MSLVRSAWKLLVGIKDGLVLCFMLLFFGLIWAGLSAKPNAASVKEGALLVDLAGSLVEQPTEEDSFAILSGTSTAVRQNRLRDVVRGLEAAATDDRIKVVVLDLDRFTGGGQTAIQRAASAVDKIRAAKKPVLAYATGYSDDSYLLAAHASEVWLDPMGLALFQGPGGSRLYYKGLMDNLGITAKVYRVGTYKSFVEPYTRTDQSPEAKAANQALVGALWQNWQDDVLKARPKAQLANYIAKPQDAITAAGGDLAQAALKAGIVDKLGDRIAFGKRVAEIAGSDDSKAAGNYTHTKFASWVAANPPSSDGDAIGVITIAGDIVDGNAVAGTAGGDTISKLLLDALAKKDLKALVVRVDSPGGSVLASEKIRQAILQAKAKGLPVIVSMGSVAASGGYWVSTPADKIFAEPSTITGSIGVFGIIPTFEKAMTKIGITTDGVTTTPLSGQPDVFAGTNESFDAVIQSSITNVYNRFLGIVGQSRKMSAEKIDTMAQGRVWDGGTARQLGLVDAFGSLDDAIAEAAKRAKLDPTTVHADYLEPTPSITASLLAGFAQEENDGSNDVLSRIAGARTTALFQAASDAEALVKGPVVRVQCLECPSTKGYTPISSKNMFARILTWFSA